MTSNATVFRPLSAARRLRAFAATTALVLLAACSTGGEVGDLNANATLVRNDPYPNVAADPARNATAPRSSSEVQRIEDRMMSLAAERGNNARGGADTPSVVEQMKALAKRNQSIAQGEDVTETNSVGN